VNVLIIGRGKSGTTVISKTIQHSMPGSSYHLEPSNIGYFESVPPNPAGHVAKLLFDSWVRRPRLLSAVINGEMPLKFQKKVFIVRDPRDVLISETLYCVYNAAVAGADKAALDDLNELLRAKAADPLQVGFGEIFDRVERLFAPMKIRAVEIYLRYAQWLEKTRDQGFVIRYEDFMAGQLQDLSRYLRIGPLSDNRDVGKELVRTRRSEACDNWKRWLTPADVERFQPEVRRVMRLLGYKDWALDPEPVITPAESFEYVSRIFAEGHKIAQRQGK
tara:strand:- start:9012 stop:9839 length:828 start_codon:yes stop_codon:yes gene_type:complete